MPRKSKTGSVYPKEWKAIATRVKTEAGWACVRCGVAHMSGPGTVLTVHHADLSPENCAWWNLLPFCARCHLSIQSRVNLDRPWVMQEHTPWFRPFIAGFYAHKYLGLALTRAEVDARLDELLALERAAVLGVA